MSEKKTALEFLKDSKLNAAAIFFFIAYKNSDGFASWYDQKLMLSAYLCGTIEEICKIPMNVAIAAADGIYLMFFDFLSGWNFVDDSGILLEFYFKNSRTFYLNL